MAQRTSSVVSRTDVSLLLAELREQPDDALYAPLLEALLVVARTLEARAPSTTTYLDLPGEHAEPFRAWLTQAALRASRSGDHAKAAAFKRIWASMKLGIP
jgi:hypothetical protein